MPGQSVSEGSLGRLSNVLLALAFLALGAAFFTPSGGPLLVFASWVLLAIGAALGLLDDLLAGRVSRERWMLAVLLLFLLAIFAKVISAAAPAPGIGRRTEIAPGLAVRVRSWAP